MIVFVNCYEEMAAGMRVLAALAAARGFAVHLVVIHGYGVSVSERLNPDCGNAHVCVNGRFHVNSDADTPMSDGEIALFTDRLRELRPQMLCFSARSKNDAVMARLIREARSAFPELPIVCGGYGPTHDPALYLKSGATSVVRGEGEIAFDRMLDRFAQGNKQFFDVPNASWLENGKLLSNPLSPVLRDFSRSPAPLAGDEYTSFIEGGKIFARDPAYDNNEYNILLGRGCIADCAYCAAPVLRKMYKSEGVIVPRYRHYSAAAVLDELERARARGVRRIIFKDEYLVGKSDALAAFFKKYKKRINLPFKANLHHEQLLRFPELLSAALEAGLEAYPVGFQSGSESMARFWYNRKHRFADLLELAQILFHQFVKLQYHFVSGTSLNTEQEFFDKLELVRLLPFDPLHPQRTMLFDFQFFPQPRSKMTQEVNAGRITRSALDEWAEKALLCQIRRVTEDGEFAGILESQKNARRQATELQTLYQRLLATAKKARYAALRRSLAGSDVFFITDGDAATADKPDCLLDARIVGTYSLRDINETTPAEEFADIACSPHIPVIVASPDLLGGGGRRLRHTLALKNTIEWV